MNRREFVRSAGAFDERAEVTPAAHWRLLRTTQCFFENISAHTDVPGTSGAAEPR